MGIDPKKRLLGEDILRIRSCGVSPMGGWNLRDTVHI